MFFRTKILKDTPLVQLVEAFRNAEGQPRQRVVASLGDAAIPEAEKSPSPVPLRTGSAIRPIR